MPAERGRAAAGGFALALLILTVASFVSVGFSANAPLIRESLGLTPAGVGAIASAVYGTAALTSRVAGRYTDRLGPGPVLVAAMGALAAGVVVAVSTGQILVFFLGVAICGLGYGAVNPPTNVLANTRSSHRRGLAMSVKQSGIPLGGILAGLILPGLATATSWRWSMQAPVLLCVVLALASLRLRRPSVKGAGARDHGPRERIQLRLPRAYAFGFLMAGVQVTMFTFLAVYLADGRGLTASHAGQLLALLMLGGLAGRPVWGWLSDRRHHDRVRLLQGVTVLAGAGLALVPVVPLAALSVLVLAVGFCAVGWNGVYITSVGEAAPPELLGSSTGTALALVNAGAVALPPAFGLLVGDFGWSTGWELCAVASIGAAVALQLSRLRVPGSSTTREAEAL